MEDVFIRLATEADLLELQKIGKKTFYETYISDDSASDIEQYLSEKFSTEQLANELKNSATMFFFAEIEDEIIGYLKINIGKVQIKNNLNKAVEIERIYVNSNSQRKNAGKELLNKAIEIAKKHKIKNVWLSVWEENQKAIKFYEKNGFVAFDTHPFKMGQEEAINIMMNLMLNPLERR